MHHIVMYDMFMDVSNEHLNKLDPKGAVALMEDILHTDAQMSGIRPTRISISAEIYARDGGIDAKTTDVKKESNLGSIKAGTTCYQIKSGKFAPTMTNIRRMLFNKEDLKSEIRGCFECNGTFILVLTGYDGPHSNEKISKMIQQKLNKYKNAKVSVWTQTTLRGFLKNMPVLRLRILGIEYDSFMFYDDWSKQDDMKNKAELGPQQVEFVNTIRKHLEESTDGHLRITADPGIGKTKLVLEALRPKNISSVCLYTDKPSEFLKSKTLKYLTDDPARPRAILAIDECDEYAMVEIWNRIKPHRQRLRLITIYNETGVQMNNMRILDAPQLDDAQIIQILKSYGVDKSRLYVWCAACRPSPRAAHVIGNNLKMCPDDIFRPPDTVLVWDRYIASKEHLDSDEFRTRKKILLWLSIFRRIGYGDMYSDEQKILEDFLKCGGIEKFEFQGTVETLKKMRILQGDTTLYITPKILHLYLYDKWRQTYGDAIPSCLDELLKNAANMPEQYEYVCRWYADMFSYAKGMDIPDKYTKEIFRPGGLADRYSLLYNEWGAGMFYNIAKADVGAALGYLERNIKTKDGRLPIKVVYGQIVKVLAGAAMKRDFFYRSANLLLILSEAESGPFYDSAENTFVKLFHPPFGKNGQTEVPLSERVPLIRDALSSDIPYKRRLGIRACEVAITRQVLPPPYVDTDMWPDYVPWTPKTETETYAYYVEVLEVMRSHMSRFAGKERAHLVDVVLKHGLHLLSMPMVAETVLDIIQEAYRKHHASAKSIIEAVLSCANRYHLLPMSDKMREGLSKLQDMVVGSDYRSMIRWYVGESYGLEPDLHQHTLDELARQSMDMATLKPELDWLVTTQATHGREFGYALGSIDSLASVQHILNAQKRCTSPSMNFLGGYMRAHFERNPDRWDGIMNELCQDMDLRPYIPELTAVSGMTDGAAIRVYDVICNYNLEPSLLKPFTYTNSVGEIPESTFQKWIQLLWDDNLESRRICLNLYWQYYVQQNRMLPGSARKMLLSVDAQVFVEHPYEISCWAYILASYIRQHPEDDAVMPDALKFVAANLADTGVEDVFFTEMMRIAGENPTKAWEYVASLFEHTKDPAKTDNSNHYLIKSLLDNGALVDKISFTVVSDWIDMDVERRAPLVAYVLPDKFDISLKFLFKYGEIDNIGEILMLNHVPHGMPSKIKNHTQKLKEIESLKKDTPATAARAWLEKCEAALVRDKEAYTNRYKMLQGI